MTRTKLIPHHGHTERVGEGWLSGWRGPQSPENQPQSTGPSQMPVEGWVGVGEEGVGASGRTVRFPEEQIQVQWTVFGVEYFRCFPF